MTMVMCDLRRSCALPKHPGPRHASTLEHTAATTAARIAQALCRPVRLDNAVGRLRRARRSVRTACSVSGVRDCIGIAFAVGIANARSRACDGACTKNLGRRPARDIDQRRRQPAIDACHRAGGD